MTLACYSLGGAKRKIHSEEIMNKAFQWNREKYSWILKKFNRYPDNEGLRKSLFKARTEKYVVGAYARQIIKDGWQLTQKGILICNEYEHLIDLKTSKKTLNQYEKKLIRDFKKNNNVSHIEKDELNFYQLAEMLETPPGNVEILRTRFNELLRLCVIEKDNECLRLLNYIKESERFKNLLDDEKFYQQYDHFVVPKIDLLEGKYENKFIKKL